MLRASSFSLTLLGLAVSGMALTQTTRRVQGRSPAHRSRPAPAASSPAPAPLAFQALSGAAVFPLEFRTVDGAGNNLANPTWGAAEHPMLRVVPAAYMDGVEVPSGASLPNPRAISNTLSAQVGSVPNSLQVSDFVWQWGQFLDHDLDETPIQDPAEAFDIPIPAGDPWFDPMGTGAVAIPLDRSAYESGSGVRQQVNAITAYIDASNVYGSDAARASGLRRNDGSGKLRTSAGDLLPFNVTGLPNAGGPDPTLFVAGDVRANEQVCLATMHTLFVREHNFWCDILATRGSMTGEQMYQWARAIVTAEMQAITYNEFLPVLLGPGALAPYTGYDDQVDASIANVFATAAYRFGHSMLSPQLLRLEADGSAHAAGHLSLQDAFFDPNNLISIGPEPYLRGLAAQQAQEVDALLVDDVRNFLFGPPGAGGFDLAALNLQRGRDHGLPTFNGVRVAYGLPAYTSFADISDEVEVQNHLAQVYATIDDVDPWIGLLCEDHVAGALVGETLRVVLADQFTRLRDGDRFWYQEYLPSGMSARLGKQTLATIIRRNTDIGAEIQDDVFHVFP